MVILVCVIVMFNLLMRCSATSPNIINVSVKNGHAALKEEMQPFLMLYKPFTVHVYSDVHLKSIRCSSRHSYIEPFVNAPLDFIKYSSPSTSTSIIYALKTNIYATVEMNDTWYCTLFLDSNETPDLNFNITVTIDKTGSSGVPEQEQWVQADTRTGKSNSIELNRPPFIDIYINKAMDKLVHTTTVKLEWNKSFTITVFVASNVQLNKRLKKITCYKENHILQIYVNQPLTLSLHTQHNYSAVVPSTRNMESSIWTCQLFGPSVSLYKLSFNVSFKYSMPPVTEIPLSSSTPEQNIKSDPKMADVATVSIAITGTTKPATVPIATTGTTKPDANSTGQSEESSILPYIWAGTVAATLVVVVLVAFMVRSLIMRKRRQEKEEETNIINYENLPGHNEGAMAMPPQWDDYSQQLQQENPYTYITPPTKNEYAQPKDLRIPETLYAEVGAQSYGTGTVNRGATVYANSEPLKPMPEYSQVVPKNMRKNPSAPQVLPKLKNDNYAQVLPKSERNRPDGSKYTNVFESPRYANMENKTDYAEPAYCEVDAFDKRQ